MCGNNNYVCMYVCIIWSSHLFIRESTSKLANPACGQLTQAESGAYLGIPPDFRDGVHLLSSNAIRHRVSPEFMGSRNCVPMAFTAESAPAQGQ